jgi:hypothetical protein
MRSHDRDSHGSLVPQCYAAQFSEDTVRVEVLLADKGPTDDVQKNRFVQKNGQQDSRTAGQQDSKGVRRLAGSILSPRPLANSDPTVNRPDEQNDIRKLNLYLRVLNDTQSSKYISNFSDSPNVLRPWMHESRSKNDSNS